MVDAISIASSGLMALDQGLSATASNIANAGTTGALPTTQNPASTVYKPLTVNYTSQADGGVSAQVSASQNYSAAYDPSSAYANAQGLVAAPNVDFAQQIVNLIETKISYKADVDVIKTQDEMTDELLNTVA
jgi:flagellar basal-body rod protein FlgC